MNQLSSHGVNIKGESLNGWRPLLYEWTQCFARFCKVSRTFPVLSKPEQTNVGILAGAAWRIGFVAFQEMSRLRDGLGGWGYADLYICESSNNIAEYVECKGGVVHNKSSAQRMLDNACQAVSTLNIKEEPTARKVGVAFCNVGFNAIDDSAIKGRLHGLFEELSEVDCDAMAWCFPELPEYYKDGSQTILGVVLLAKLI